MAMTVGQNIEEGEQEVMAAINTTPLVDVMLVLLIIFLITIPVVIQQVPLELPKERNVVTQTKPENIVISVNKDGDVFWKMEYMRDSKALFNKLKGVAVMPPPRGAPREVGTVASDFDGTLVSDGEQVPGRSTLVARRRGAAQQPIQPKSRLRPDRLGTSEHSAAVMASAQRLGITKMGSIGA